MSDILVVAAHPDDEVLGCGGTIAKYAAMGFSVDCMILGEGATSRNDSSFAEMEKLKDYHKKVVGHLEINRTWMFSLPDQKFDSYPLLTIIKMLENKIQVWGMPKYVLTHHPGDLNIDHRMTSQAVQTIFRPQPEIDINGMLFFETLSSTEWSHGFPPFEPTVYIDITDQLEMKLEAFSFYEDELREPPHPRSLEAIGNLAKVRGSQSGYIAAEAFSVGYMRGEMLL